MRVVVSADMESVFIPNVDFFPSPHIFVNTNINFSLCRYYKTKRNERREVDRKD